MVNPYEVPSYLPPRKSWWRRAMEEIGTVLGIRTRGFADGEVVMHEGVAFFVDPEEPAALFAALPSAIPSAQRMRRNVNEALRLLPEFLAAHPEVHPVVHGRQLVVRMIESYQDLDYEIYPRVTLPADALAAAQTQGAH